MESENVFVEITEETSEPAKENINGAEPEEETEDFTALLNNDAEKPQTSHGNHNGEQKEIPKVSEDTRGTYRETARATGSNTQQTGREQKLFQLPLTRIRNIMKLDPELHIASNEALFAVTRSTELFIESLAREAFMHTQQAKKKTVQKRDVDMAISAVDSLLFLEGAMDF